MNDVQTVKTILANGAKIDEVDDFDYPAIHYAVGLDTTEILKILLAAGAKADTVDKNGEPLIVWATEMDNPDAIKVLIAAGAKVDVTDKDGEQPIHLAANTNANAVSRASPTELVKALLASGAKMDAKDRNGDQPLHWAARRGNEEMVKLLLAAGASANATDKNGDQPLHWAARYGNFGNTELVKLLVTAGAKVDVSNRNGDQPILMAKHIGPTETDKGNKGMLDEATINYFENTIDPILINAKLCQSSNDCDGHHYILCVQSNSLECDVYGISDETVRKEIVFSLQKSGLRIKRLAFWRNAHGNQSFFEKPLSQFDGNE